MQRSSATRAAVAAWAILITVLPASGSVHVIALIGAQAPDEATGAMFTNFGTPSLNNLGTAAFLATVSGPGVTTGQETGIWSGNSAAIARSVRAGMPVPSDATAYFANFSNPILDNANKITAISQLNFTAGTPAPETVAASGAPGALDSFYRRGQTAPGLGGLTFVGSASTLVHNTLGQSAFNASVAGAGVSTANDLVIYSQDTGDSLRLVAREGNAAPRNSRRRRIRKLVRLRNQQRGASGFSKLALRHGRYHE
jgi:hypothetical protein